MNRMMGMWSKHWPLLLTAALVAGAIYFNKASAAEGTTDISWTLSTTGCEYNPDGTLIPCKSVQLIGDLAVTEIRLFVDVKTIPDDACPGPGVVAPSCKLPPIILTADKLTTSVTRTLSLNQTLYVRAQQCIGVVTPAPESKDLRDCSLMTMQKSKKFTSDLLPGVKPGVPTDVTIKLIIKR